MRRVLLATAAILVLSAPAQAQTSAPAPEAAAKAESPEDALSNLRRVKAVEALSVETTSTKSHSHDRD